TAPVQSVPSPPAQPASIAGIWVLNPALTARPDEIGFNPDWAAGAGGESGSGGRPGGGRGRRGGGGRSGGGNMGVPAISHESMDDGARVQQLTLEARTPPGHITIVQKPDSISIADDQGHSRTFHPTGQVEDHTIGTTPLPTTTRWDKGG